MPILGVPQPETRILVLTSFATDDKVFPAIKAGHQIRIAIAGHDASSFEPVAQESEPVITVYWNEMSPSSIILPAIE